MPLQENLNVSPYYADYNPLADYYSLLFKAGYPVQARELTNMQLMQQHQLETFMSRFMKEGDQIVPGERAYASPAYVRVSAITQGATAAGFIGYRLTGAVSGVVAIVQFAVDETTDDDTTFYVSYESQGSTSEYTTFIEGETLLSDTPNSYTATVGVTGVSKPLTVNRLGVTTESPALGRGTLYTVAEGYYFTNGTSVRNTAQTITLDKYTTVPSYQVGFVVTEQFISSNDDPALLDNSQGSSNFAAPGADRLKINLTLTKTTENSEIDNFIQLAEITQGVIVSDPTQQTKWQWLYDILAKRTYDESGDYIITEFPVNLTSYSNTDITDGLFDANADGLYPPVPGSGETDLLTFSEANNKYVVKVSPGEAYVQGFNVGINKPVYVFGDKPRVQSFRSDVITPITTPFDVMMTNVYNIPDFINSASVVNTEAYDAIVMYRNFNDGYVGESTSADAQNNINPINAGQAPPLTYHVLCDSNVGAISTTGVVTIYREGRGAVVQIPSNKVIARWDGTDEDGTNAQINVLGGAKVLIVTKINPSPTGVVYPRYFMPKSIVDTTIAITGSTSNGVAGWDSTYDMGIIKADYFTEFLVLDDEDAENFSTSWTVGNLVFAGNDRKSFGTVETGTTNEHLIVSNIVGNFEAGQIVIQGTKKARINRPGGALSFEFFGFGTSNSLADLNNVTSVTVSALGSSKILTASDFSYRSTDNTLQLTRVGRSKLQNFPFPKDAPDGGFDAVSVAKRINLKAVATDGTNTVDGYVVTLPGKTSNSMVKTKSFFSNLAQTANFSADLAIDGNLDVNTINIADGSLFSGNANDNFITCNRFDGNAANELSFGDLLIFTDSTGATKSHLVMFATEPVGYGSDRAKSIIYLTTPLVNNVSSSVVSRVRMKALGEPENNLLFQLPQRTVASLQSNSQKTGITYYVLQEFVQSVASGASSVEITLTPANERFIQGNNNVIVTPTDIGSATIGIGRQFTVASAAVQDDGRKMVINFAEGTQLDAASSVKIIVPIQVTNAKAKQKLLKSNQVLTISTASEYSGSVISLGRADVISVTSVKNAQDKELIDNYNFNNGQTDNLYGISTLTLVEGSPPSNSAITITYSYYEHTGDGDFFSVDSYIPAGNAEASNQNTPYAAIPVYAPIAGIPLNSENSADLYVPLRDCVDFRPVVNTLAGDPSYLPTITDGKDATSATNFKNADNSGNGFAPRMPLIGSNFECNIAFYQPKIDSLFMEKDGSLTLVEGVPAAEPVAPPDLATGIRLYDFKLPPYTFSIASIDTEKYNYKSYTMKDIVSLERRISRVEELVTLSILEQSALNMAVKDAVTGLDRFKNGIVVDDFNDHSQGKTGSVQYRCSMDPQVGHLRPAFQEINVELNESRQTDAQRLNYGYRKEGPQIMLNYTSERFLQNPFATRFINLQPYSVFTYEGEVELDPAIDTWKDTTRKPDLVIKDTNVYDAMVNMSEEINSLGLKTVWNSWKSTGQTKTTVNRNTVSGSQQERNEALRELAASGADIGTAGADAAQIRRLQRRGTTPPLRVTTQTKSQLQMREQTATNIKVSSGSVKKTSYGDRIVDVSLAETMRTRTVRVQAGRLKPNTRYYIYFDDVEVSRWFSADTKEIEDGDGKKYFRGAPGKKGNNSEGFGTPIISDDVGNLAGAFIVPNGRPPVLGEKFNGINYVTYDTTGPTRSFTTGTRKFRITSSSTDAQDLTQIEGFAETTYVASGVLLDKQQTIVATTIPKIKTQKTVVATEKRWQTTSEKITANYYDPVAQTFMIDEKFSSGVFVSELDVFFQTKDDIESVEAYLVTTDGQVPTTDILPYSTVIKNTDSYLRVTAELDAGDTDGDLWPKNTEVVGSVSGATGIMKWSNNFLPATVNSSKNVDNNVYRVTLKNYTGEFVPGERIIPQLQPASTSKVFIAQNEVAVDYVDITKTGTGYVSGYTTVTFSEPQLPGGVAATGTVKVGAAGSSGAGLVYEVNVTSVGSGYTKAPSATISGTNANGDVVGSGAILSVKIVDKEDSVKMGVATSEDATSATTFRFQTPIYLLSDTTYAFVVKAPTSLEYRMWTSKIGETRVGTNRRVTEQPSLGSIFLSQNGSLWTEDQTIDVKFVLRRSKFVTNQTALVNLVNEPEAQADIWRSEAVFTSAEPLVPGSTTFGSNPNIVKIRIYIHGLNSGDYVPLEGIVGNPGGIPDAELNTLHQVIDADLNEFTILVPTAATTTERGGGNATVLSVNTMYETLNVNTGAMVFGPTTLTAESISTNGLSPSQNLQANEGNSALSAIKYTRSNPVEIDLLENYYFNRSKTVLSPINEAVYNTADKLNGQKSLDVNIYLRTSDDAVSPVINLERTAAVAVRNVINNPKPTDPIYGASVATLNMSGATSGLSTIVPNAAVTFTNAQGVARTVYVDSRDDNLHTIKLKGDFVKELINTHTFTTSAIATLGVDSIDSDTGQFYYPEVRDVGVAWAKFVSRLFIFDNQCDGISLKLTACSYTKDSIRCYYRTRDVGFDGDVSQIAWTPFNENQELIETVVDANQSNLLVEKKQVVVGLPDDVNKIKVRDADNVNPDEIFNDGWQSLSWTAQDLNSFDAIEIKIVMQVDNPALAPIIDDMRLICSE